MILGKDEIKKVRVWVSDGIGLNWLYANRVMNTLDAYQAALEAWVRWAKADATDDVPDEGMLLECAITLTKTAGISWPEEADQS